MLSRATLPEVQRRQCIELKSLFSRRRGQSGSIALVVAHPGDEVIAAGGSLSEWKDLRFIHITEGSPRDLDRALQAGYECRDEYARARKHEFAEALHQAGFDGEQVTNLGYGDGEICESLATLTMSLAAALHESRPELVITHAYEGVNPDFDATAFAVQCACGLLENDGITAPVRVEAAGIFESNGALMVGRFLNEQDGEAVSIRLDGPKQQLKRCMLDCLATQQDALQGANITMESFRVAPMYDFTKAPCEGRLTYEQNGLGMNGRRWRRLAAEALRVLGLAEHS